MAHRLTGTPFFPAWRRCIRRAGSVEWTPLVRGSCTTAPTRCTGCPARESSRASLRTPHCAAGVSAPASLAYGYDVRAWPEWTVLRDITELHSLGAYIRLAPDKPAAADELRHRIR